MSQSGRYALGTPGVAPVETLTGNSGGPVSPTLGNINVVGDATTINVVGNPGTSTLTISATGGVATSFVTDAGTATPLLGVLNVLGGTNIGTTGAANNLTINLDGTTNHAVQVGTGALGLNSIAVGATNTVLLGNTGADPSWGTVPNAALTNSSVTLNSGNNITVTGGAPLSLGGTASFNLTGTTNHTVQLGNGTGSLTSLANGTTGQVLHAVTGANDPIWSAVSLTADVSGILPIANGGTNASTFTTTNGTVYFDGTRLVDTAVGTAGFVLTSNGASAPTYQAVSASGAVTSVNAGANISITGTSTAPIVNVAGTTNHSVQVGTGATGLTQIAVGATNTVLLGNTAADPSFGTVPNAALTNSSVTLNNGNNITVTGGGPLSLGGTASFNLTGTTNHTLQLGNATGSLTSLGVATNGQLPIGSTGADPVLATLTAGANITITNGAGTITIAANATSATLNYTGVNHAASPYTVLAADDYISADVTAGVISILLPNAPTTGRIFTIKDKVGLAATSNITVTTVGGAVTIDGATSFIMNTAYQAISLIFNGTSYEIY